MELCAQGHRRCTLLKSCPAIHSTEVAEMGHSKRGLMNVAMGWLKRLAHKMQVHATMTAHVIREPTTMRESHTSRPAS
jgi:hypothetical protein